MLPPATARWQLRSQLCRLPWPLPHRPRPWKLPAWPRTSSESSDPTGRLWLLLWPLSLRLLLLLLLLYLRQVRQARQARWRHLQRLRQRPSQLPPSLQCSRQVQVQVQVQLAAANPQPHWQWQRHRLPSHLQPLLVRL